MAATVSIAGTPGLTLFSAADDNTGGTWSGGSGAFDTEVFYQGTASWFYQTGKNTRSSGDFVPTTSVDMSGTDFHLYWWMKCDVMTFTEPKRLGTAAASGLTCRVESSATDFVEWHIAGSDTWGGEWKCFCMDLNNTSNNATTGDIYASGGTLNLAAVTKVTWFTDNSNSGTIRIVDNTAIDVVRFGTGLTAYGTDFNYDDIAAEDALVANKYGIIQKIDGVYFVQGHIRVVDNAGTTTFNSTAETIAFRDINCSAGLYALDFTGTGNTVVIKGLSSLSSGINENTRFKFDTSGTVGSLSLSGSNLNRAGLVGFKSGQTIETSVFNNCLQIDPSTATFDTSTISNYTGTEGGALLWPTGGNTTDINFINNDYGVEITQVVNQTFDALTFDDVAGKYDVGLSGGTSIEVAKTNGANPNSYFDHTVSGDTVTFTASFSHTLTGMAENTEVTYVLQSNGTVVFHVENVTVTGTTTYTHSGGELVDILIQHLDKIPDISDIKDITLPNGDASAQIAQFDDPNTTWA